MPRLPLLIVDLLLEILRTNSIQLFQRIIYDEAISDSHKNKITILFSEADKRLVDGSDEHLTILDLALRISGILSGA
jgi:replication factor C subunit 2/4